MNKVGGLLKAKRKKTVFYCCLIALPLLQYILFYVIVNFNSIALAFQEVDKVDRVTKSFVWFKNFEAVFEDLATMPSYAMKLKNSMILFLTTLLVGIPLAIIFSFYIYKQGMFSGAFKVFLFLPQIISMLVLVIIYKYFCELGIPAIVNRLTGKEIDGLYSNLDTQFGTVLFFTIFIGFGTQVLMYLSAMSGIDESIVEAARLDGAGYFTELRSITIPSIFPTISTFVVIGVANIFNNQMNLFSFGDNNISEGVQTLGYHLYVEIYRNSTNNLAWGELAALGLIFTAVIAPITFLVRWLFEKYGPKEE